MKVLIIGAGASGIMAAITAKKANKNLNITVAEAGDTPLFKVNISGNGKCNLTNKNITPEAYYTADPEFINTVFNQFGTEDTISFFNSLGVLCITEREDYYYPMSLQAKTVSQALLNECRLLGINILCNTKIDSIECIGDKYRIDMSHRIDIMDFDKVVVSCGTGAGIKEYMGGDLLNNISSNSISLNNISINSVSNYRNQKSTQSAKTIPNIKFNSFRPGLCGLKIKKTKDNDVFFKEAKSVRCRIKAERNGICHKGEMQINDYTLSGIVIFQLSLFDINEDDLIYIDFLPDKDSDSLCKLIMSQDFYEKRSAYDILSGLYNNKLAMALLKGGYSMHNVRPFDKNLNHNTLKKLFYTIKKYPFEISGYDGEKKAQICSGGVDISEINPLTMESLKYKNLYFTGECIDVSGICGGYNLQFAWSSGYIAGKAIAEEI